MNNEKHQDIIFGKVKKLMEIYSPLSMELLCDLETSVFETEESLREVPQNVNWNEIKKGTKWGKEWCNAWFKTSFTVPDEYKGKRIALAQSTGAVECLIFLNGKPSGIFDTGHNEPVNSCRLHRSFILSEHAVSVTKSDL
jgi:alpha-mannosidase